MKILGLKLTHDGAIAGIDGNKLIFCVEREKVANGPRYGRVDDLALIDQVCKQFNFTPDFVVVDGWKKSVVPDHEIQVSSYHEWDGKRGASLLDCTFVQNIERKGTLLDFYGSYPHMTGHIMGSYCTSPWAAEKEDCYVITMDGGQNPRVHYLNPKERELNFRGNIHELYGVIYGIMARYFGPYKIEGIENTPVDDLDYLVRFGGYETPGKLMSWIANGEVDDILLEYIDRCYGEVHSSNDWTMDYALNGYAEHEFMRRIKRVVGPAGATQWSDATVLRTIHHWLEMALVVGAMSMIPAGSRVIFTGGSALNIKWNSALRRSGFDVWVPPFPNDSGSAIGAACAEMAISNDQWCLEWSVYCGPEVLPAETLEGWESRNCSLIELAQVLAYDPMEPVVFLTGRAEVGPRALGNRSIFANPCFAENKETLNRMKKREQFRPVAPICLEHRAAAYFHPGTSDPYMLFDHMVRPEREWVMPAVVHIDKTARLQTITREQNPTVAALLENFCDITGVPMLCNTSANFNGSGFFPDVRSAMEWGEAKYIWNDGTLYTKKGEPK